MKHLFVYVVVLAILFPGWPASRCEARDHAILAFEPEGSVAVKIGDCDWKPLVANRMLQDGYYLRTGSDGSVKLRVDAAGTVKTLQSGSLIVVSGSRIELLSGELSEGKIWQKLAEAFKKTIDPPRLDEKSPPVPIQSETQPMTTVDE